MIEKWMETGAVELFFVGFKQILAQLGLDESELDEGMDDLRDGLQQIGLEARRAERNGVAFSDAVKQDNFLYLKKLHLGIMDILTLQLSRELVGLMSKIVKMPTPPPWDFVRVLLAKEACAPQNTTRRAIARFLLFQIIRLNLVVLTWESASGMLASGIEEEELERIAEGNLHKMLQHPEDLNEEIRPDVLLTAASMMQLQELQQLMVRELQKVAAHLAHWYQRRAMLETQLRQMDARDAVLVRNFFAPAWEEQRLQVERIMELHPLLYENSSRAAVDKRMSRAMQSIKENKKWPARKRAAVIDLILETARKFRQGEMNGVFT